MSKPILIIQKNKKDKYFAQIQYEGKPLQPCSLFIPKDDKLNGEELDIEINPNKKGEILKIVCNGNILYSNTSSLINQVGMVTTMKTGKLKIKRDRQNKIIGYDLFDTKNAKIDTSHPIKIEDRIIKSIENKYTYDEFSVLYKDISYNSEKPIIKKIIYKNGNDESIIFSNESHAPYNFVPLNKIIVSNESFKDLDRTKYSGNSGYINLKITNKAPIYIRDSSGEEEIKKDENLKQKDKKNNKYINSNFFSPYGNGRFAIPGSSLRGLIRTFTEIVSFSQFQFFNDTRLYFRGIGDLTGLRDVYSDKMQQPDGKGKSTGFSTMAGILKKTGYEEYQIVSSGKFKDGYEQISAFEGVKLLKGINKKREEFNFYDLGDKYLVVSGNMGNKFLGEKPWKKYEKKDWIVHKPKADAEIIKFEFLNEEDDIADIEDYKCDKNRKSKDLLKELELFPEGIPCFYTKYNDEQGNERIGFGHTPMFRLPYEKTIGDHVIQDELKENEFDYATSIFGIVNEKKGQAIAGRLYFSDSIIQNDVSTPELVPHVLANPKPTTFQHYLEQVSPSNPAHYNNNTSIKGNKLYWHKNRTISENNNEWELEAANVNLKGNLVDLIKDFNRSTKEEKEGNKNFKYVDEKNKTKVQSLTQFTIIQPIPENNIFQGKIHFENLSDEELGCLLFALDLPEGCAHKIGMGKPLGLGSIEIKPELVLIDRKKSYKSFSKDNSFETGEEKISDFKEYKKKFEEDVLRKMKEADDKGANNISSLWNHPRLKELKVMLDWKNKPENKYTDYMQIEKKNPDNTKFNEYRLRPILDKPSEYIRNITS